MVYQLGANYDAPVQDYSSMLIGGVDTPVYIGGNATERGGSPYVYATGQQRYTQPTTNVTNNYASPKPFQPAPAGPMPSMNSPLVFQQTGSPAPIVPAQSINIGGRNYPSNSVMAYQPGQSVQGVRGGGGISDATNAGQPQVAPDRYANLNPPAQDISQPSPAQAGGAQQQGQPGGAPLNGGMMQSLGDPSGSAAPVNYDTNAQNYPLGGVAIPGQQGSPPASDQPLPLTSPEMEKHQKVLEGISEQDQKVILNGNPFDNARQFYQTHSPSTAQKIFYGLAVAFSKGRQLPPMTMPSDLGGRMPASLNDYLKTPAYMLSQKAYDDALTHYRASEKAAYLDEKQTVQKKADLQEKYDSHKAVPPAVKESVMKYFAGQPAIIPDEQGKPVLNLQKVSAVDMYIQSGLIDPNMRSQIINTYAVTEKTDNDKKNMDMAHARVANQLQEQTAKLRLEKLQASMGIDMELKQLSKQLRTEQIAASQLSQRHVTQQMANEMIAQQNTTERMLNAKSKEQRIANDHLDSQRMQWEKIAGAQPGPLAPYSKEAINEARNNVKLIDMYRSGKLDYMMTALSEQLKKPATVQDYLSFVHGADTQTKRNLEDRAFLLSKQEQVGPPVPPKQAAPAPQRAPQPMPQPAPMRAGPALSLPALLQGDMSQLDQDEEGAL